MDIPAAALLDRAMELAALELPEDSPAVPVAVRDLKLYFDGLVAEGRIIATAQRRFSAWSRGLLRHELTHDRARRLVLDIVDPESGATAEEVLASLRTEHFARELARWGRPLESRERLAIAGLSGSAEREEVSGLLRTGLLRTDPGGFSTSAAMRRRACAWLFVLLITGTLALMLWVLRSGLQFDPWYFAAHVVGTGVLAWWFSRDIFAAARSAEAAVKAANDALRPRPLGARRRS